MCAALAGWYGGAQVQRTRRRISGTAEAMAQVHRLRRAWAAWRRRMAAPALADHARRTALTRRAFAALLCHAMARRRCGCDTCSLMASRSEGHAVQEALLLPGPVQPMGGRS